MNGNALMYSTESELPLLTRGKVRDIYDLGDALLFVATDRISCFDVVLPTPIPHKGQVLTALSQFWFNILGSVVPHHYLGTDVSGHVRDANTLAELEGRSMIVRKAKPLPVEAIVRGYLSGSAWKEYSSTGTFRGLELPTGLRESDALPEPFYTPSTKAPQGMHDENITYEDTIGLIGADRARQVRDYSLRIYQVAAKWAAQCGIILADTKFEFGLIGDQVTLIDEVLTPDSSRFWPKDGYAPGGPQPSYDKQYVRDYLEELGWNKKPPAPDLPLAVVEKTSQKYREALRCLTGNEFPPSGIPGAETAR